MEKKKASLTIEEYDIDYLLAHRAKYNPRKITRQAKVGLKRSVETFGYVQNVVFNRRTQTVVSGHQRLEVLKEEGYDRVQVHVVDLDEEQEKKLNIAMNATTITGEFSGEVIDMLDDIMKNDSDFYDTLSLYLIKPDDIDVDQKKEEEKKSNADSIPDMELLPYENYDCVLIICKDIQDWGYIETFLELQEKRVVSPSSVANRKVGKVRAVPAKRLIDAIRKLRKELSGIDVDLDLDIEGIAKEAE